MNYLIVGAGLFGAVFAHEAAKSGNQVTVIEKRDHIAGNIYTKEIDGIQAHMYGAHIFHTSNKKVWDYVHQFSSFNRYTNSPVANYKGHMYNLPFNMNTFSEMWGIRTPQEAMAKINGVNRIIVHSHTSGENKNFKHELLKRFFSPVFSKMATVLLAPSYDAAYWQFPKKAFKKKGKLIKNGIEVDKYLFNCEKRKKIRKQLEFSTNDTVLGNVGRLSSEKNQIFLIRLLKSLVVINKKYKLLLVGDGPQYKILKTIVEKQNLSSNVKFVGNVNNVEDYLQAMDIFLFPSKYEGLGIASIEAQASGLPIIASTGVPEDINITGNVKFLSLGSPINEWIKVVRATDVNNRLNNMAKDRIVDKGYDIRTTAAELRRIYLENDK